MPADRVRDASTTAQPEGVGMKFLDDALRFKRVFTLIQRLQNTQGALTRASLVKR